MRLKGKAALAALVAACAALGGCNVAGGSLDGSYTALDASEAGAFATPTGVAHPGMAADNATAIRIQDGLHGESHGG